MRRGTRPVLIALFLLGLLAVSGRGWRTAAFDLSSAYTGRGEINGPFRLELVVSPPVSMPGQTLTLEMRLTNQEGAGAIPAVALTLPDALTLDRNLLPAGTTINLQSRELNWMPLSSAGGTDRMVASLRVETADIEQPEREIIAALRFEGREQLVRVPVWIGIPPQIEQIVSPAQVAVGQPVRFRAEFDGSGPFAQKWDLGDGRRLDVPDPVVVYPAPGIYQVALEAANPLTAVSAMRTVTVVPHPAAQFQVDDDTPGVGQPIAFLSQSGGLPPLSYRWEFGDGNTSDIANPTHQYEAVGSYQVRLVIENNFGVSEAFWQVTVGVPPEAVMVLSETVASGESVSGEADGESVDLFTWDMGDGTTYQGEQVSHVYRRQGDYYVSLSASNAFGSTQLGQWVRVSQGMAAAYLPVVLHANLFLSAAQAIDPLRDPLGIALEPVPLDEPFMMEPLEVPPGTSLAQQLLLTVNEARSRFDLAPLNHVVELTVAAQKHVDDMAAFAFAAHVGSDGSFPAERLIWSRYSGGYAGEATAWGFQQPHQAVEFWINSPAHRRIVLNRFATDIGVGYRADFNAPNVWYWTAEFGNASGQPAAPTLRLGEPAAQEPIEPEVLDAVPLITDEVDFGWNWPLPLEDGHRFVVYLVVNDEIRPVGLASDPELGTRFVARGTAFPTALDYQDEVGSFEWLVRLESESGQVVAQSERRLLWLAPDPSLPAPTPVVSPTAVPTAQPGATPTPTATPMVPRPTPRPPNPTPQPLITATPSP